MPSTSRPLADLLLRNADALPRDLAGRRIVISAGGTREPLDPVRYLGNRSSGRQGYALALVAAARGAEVTLVSANVGLADPPAVTVIPVQDARDLRSRHDRAHPRGRRGGDGRRGGRFPAGEHRPRTKIKKRAGLDPEPLTPGARTPTSWPASPRPAPTGRGVVVGFAAETGDEHGSALDYARDKLARKGCDLLVLNRVDGGRAFEVADNAGVLLAADGSEPVQIPLGPKTVLAGVLLRCDRCRCLRTRRRRIAPCRSAEVRNDRTPMSHRVKSAHLPCL